MVHHLFPVKEDSSCIYIRETIETFKTAKYYRFSNDQDQYRRSFPHCQTFLDKATWDLKEPSHPVHPWFSIKKKVQNYQHLDHKIYTSLGTLKTFQREMSIVNVLHYWTYVCHFQTLHKLLSTFNILCPLVLQLMFFKSMLSLQLNILSLLCEYICIVMWSPECQQQH